MGIIGDVINGVVNAYSQKRAGDKMSRRLKNEREAMEYQHRAKRKFLQAAHQAGLVIDPDTGDTMSATPELDAVRARGRRDAWLDYGMLGAALILGVWVSRS